MIIFHGWCRVALLLAVALASVAGDLCAQQPPIRIMPLGDSITYGEALTAVEGGYRNRLYTLLTPPTRQFNPDYVGTFKDANNPTLPDVDHQGKPGIRADQVLASLGEWLNLVEDPDVVLLLIGTNDIWGNQSVSSTLTDLDNLIEEIATRRPFAKIIVSNLPPRYDGLKNPSKVLYETLQQQYNAGIPAIVADHVALGHQVTLVDMHSVMTPFDYSSDDVHPSTGGYNKMADVWAPALSAVTTPQGGSNPPVIARATGLDNLTQVAVTFSKPVADDAVNLSNFAISGGVTLSAASLDATTKRTITLTTTSQTPGLAYTLTISGVKDRTAQQNLIAPLSKLNFLGRTVNNGGFENGSSGWTLSGNVLRESEVIDPNYAASEGEFLLAFNGSQLTPNGVASQTFATTVGRTYNLSFDVGVLTYNASQQRLQVSVQGAGTLVSDIATISRNTTTVPTVRWLPRNYAFVANSTSTTLVFTDVSTTSDGLDLLLDKVRLTPADTLSVTSSLGSGVNMTISPTDLSGTGNGATGLIRSYNPGTSVSVTAPASHLGKNFIKWQRNGVDLPGTGVTTSVSIDGNQSLNAVYEPNTNSPPVANADSGSVNEGGNVLLNLATNDTDPDNGLDLTSIAIVSGPARGSLVIHNNGTVTYTHNGSETTSDSFTYTIQDQANAVSNTATVNITVTSQNDAPVAVNDSGIVNEDGSVILNLAANDTDADNSLNLGSIVVVTGPIRGSLVNHNNGTVTYTHNGSETTTDSFTYTIKDAANAASNTATVSITVTPQNDAPFAVNDSGIVNEGGGVILNLAANDTDADNSLILGSIVIVTGPIRGSLVNHNNGTVTYTHNGSETTSDSFTYTIMDAANAVSNTATVSITVTPQNDAPVAVNDSGAVNEGGSVVLNLAANDTDADNSLNLGSIVIVTGPANGSLINNNDGTVTYTHNDSETTTDSFTYTIMDAANAVSNIATVGMTVIPQNDAPVAVNDSGAVNEGGSVILNLAANDTDADNSLNLGSIVIVTGPVRGSLLNNNDGTVTYTHNGSETTTDSFTYTIEDPSNAVSNTATVSITVTPQNDSPVAANDSGTVNEGGNVLLNLAANDTDSDDGLDLASIVIVTGPANGSLLNNNDGTVTYTHNGSETTTDSFTYTIEDPSNAVSNTATVSITVTPQNDAPVAANDSGSVNEGGNVLLNLAANDTDSDDGLDLASIAIVTGPANGSLLNNNDGTVTYTHNGSETTTDSFTYTIEDPSNAVSNTATVSITVTPQNDAPVAANDSGSVNEGGNVLLNLAANDTDSDDGLDLASIAIVTGPANGSLLNNNDGTVTYTHNGSETTTDSFTYTIEDPSNAVSNTATVSITVTPQNDAPVAANDSGTVNEGGNVLLNLAANDTDPDDGLDLTSIVIVTGPANGSLLNNNDGTVTYTHNGSETTTDSFTYTIEDPSNAVSNTATVNITVTPVNDTPVATNDSGTVNEGGNVLLNLAANDTDSDDGLDLTSIVIVTGPVNGSLLNNNDGTVTYTHNGSETTTDSFTYTIEDPSNAISNIATVSITVTPQNDTPVAANDSGTVNEGGNVLLNLAANDTDSDDGLDLTSIVIVTGPANGSLINNNNGTVTYTHNGSETTTDSFTYTIEDPSNAVSDTATVSITVTPQNDAPVATNDSGSVNEGSNVLLNLAANDTDPDDGLDLTSVAIVAGPVNGSLLNNNDGTVTYTHNGSETTTDNFTYTIEDPSNAISNIATVSITVTPQNDTPVANNPSLQTNEDTALPIVLTGDDPDGGTLVYQVAAGPSHGLLSGDAPNLTYTPNPDFHGLDSFTFTVSDGIAPPAQGTVSINVIEVGGTPFEEWAASHGIAADPLLDPDGDGAINAVEYVIGGDPDESMDGGLLPQGVLLTNQPGGEPEEALPAQFCFSYRMVRRVRNDTGTQVLVEWSENPAGPWAVADGSHGETLSVEEGALVDVVRVSIPVNPAQGRLFARLRVAVTPEP